MELRRLVFLANQKVDPTQKQSYWGPATDVGATVGDLVEERRPPHGFCYDSLMANCLLSLGSNLGDRGAHLQAALRSLSSLPQTSLLAQSSFRDTQPAGGPVQDPYLNAAAIIETSLDPLILLRRLQLIESSLGRVRTQRWGPRRIDLDLLLYDQLELNSPDLTVPHPRMAFRRFVLEPAVEIAAEMVYPINGWTVRMLAEHSHKADRTIVLRSTDGSNEQLLNSLADLPNVDIFRYQRKSRGDLSTRESCHKWTIFDRQITKMRTPPALVVVWQPTATNLESLDKSRRSKQRGPHLWIPGVTIEQARQEVIAAMAAME